jgi:hypothetical protein
MKHFLKKEEILKKIVEEKDSYLKYKQSCLYYQIKPDPMVESSHLKTIHLLETLLNLCITI